jgi:WD40 repeat protein
VRLWDVQTGRPLCEPLRGHTGVVLSVSFSPDGNFVYSGSYDKTIRAWDPHRGISIGRPLCGHTKYVMRLETSPDGSRIISGSYDGTLRICDSQSFFWETEVNACGCEVFGPEKVPSVISGDGWIKTDEGRLLFWVPKQYRNAMLDDCLFCISTKDEDHSVRIVWDKLYHGKGWTGIWTASGTS